MTTVFEITAGANGIRTDAVVRMALGAAGLVAGILGLVRRRRPGRSSKDWLGFAFLTGWAAVWLVMHIPLWRIGITDVNRLLQVHRDGKSAVVEGRVHVSHGQPATGHTSGDKITVGDEAFEVNYFLVTPGYRQTISHGGVLREGVYARLHHHHGVILKVEVGN